MNRRHPLHYALGLDAGPASIGWAVIELDSANQPIRLERAGVRRFDAGVEGDMGRGKDETLSKKRREARGPRRQTWRRQWRLRKVFRSLQNVGLLPVSPCRDHDARHNLLLQLDRQLREELTPIDDRQASHVFPYWLRALALERQLSPYAFGRALYHLAQRRGFLGNLKAGRDSDERSVVKKGISELQMAIDRAGAPTLGAYFARLDPEQERIRGRWTSRQMYRDEFERIWEAQRPYQPLLTEDHKSAIKEAIFNQRPLKSQRALIGRCDLEPYRRRVPTACLPYQKFRVLQRVNDLEVTCPDREIRRLNESERNRILDALNREGDVSWAAVRELLGMKKSPQYGRNYEFNFESGGDKKLVGNRTAAKLIGAIGDCWQSFSTEQQTEFVDDILSFESENELVAHLQRRWKLTESLALAVADLRLEDGYGNLSRRAIVRLRPLMEQGESYATARKKVYRDRLATHETHEHLPPFSIAMRAVRNPAVMRTMSELRKVVNALIRQYGKPAVIRIELARDLKHSRKRRQQMADERDRNTKSREDALTRLLKEMGERYATDRNVLKLRLAEECNWKCPYTGRSFGMDDLMGDESQYDIEHIIPFGRSLDNSFVNKTLCYHEENRQRKSGQTPFEAYGQSVHWEEILSRVRHFKGDCAARKLKLFQTPELPNAEEFIARQLSDTRFLSRVAAEYLASLYGGRWDGDGSLRVQVSPGRVTAYLRRAWDLNRILGHPDNKDRADHRHHAIDAFVIAVSNPKSVKRLSKAAERAEELGLDDLFVEVDPPWNGFQWMEVGDVIEKIYVSSRVNRKLGGALHEETILSKPHRLVDKHGKPGEIHHVRKPLAKMSRGEIESIVDSTVRKVVLEKLEKLGGEPKKAFADPNNHPYLLSHDGRLIPIHSARIRKPDATIAVGKGSKLRHVCPGENHHMEIVAVLDTDGKHKKWEGTTITRFEAVRRWQHGEPIVQSEYRPGRAFVCSLANGEHILVPSNADGDEKRLLRVTVISGNSIEFVLHHDARPITLRKKERDRTRYSVGTLAKIGAEKVAIDPLGTIQVARD
jgi:CRISPR-associated endonuclease Csn1